MLTPAFPWSDLVRLQSWCSTAGSECSSAVAGWRRLAWHLQQLHSRPARTGCCLQLAFWPSSRTRSHIPSLGYRIGPWKACGGDRCLASPRTSRICSNSCRVQILEACLWSAGRFGCTAFCLWSFRTSLSWFWLADLTMATGPYASISEQVPDSLGHLFDSARYRDAYWQWHTWQCQSSFFHRGTGYARLSWGP